MRSQRLIPAHAGKTSLRTPGRRRRRAHPRSRGENLVPPISPAAQDGSSPLTRGKRILFLPCLDKGRLIPAHAGKTKAQWGDQFPPSAHPRSRGENDLVTSFFQGRPGSSPLTRGKLGARWRSCRTPGLIPAHAGKTLTCLAAPTTPPGSSPLTRGKRGDGDELAEAARLIPAHAGKTVDADRERVAGQAHPRSRGENWLGNIDTLAGFGSSPLTRGKLAMTAHAGSLAGLIPAHAGKTVCSLGLKTAGEAHPRSRGENQGGPLPIW